MPINLCWMFNRKVHLITMNSPGRFQTAHVTYFFKHDMSEIVLGLESFALSVGEETYPGSNHFICLEGMVFKIQKTLIMCLHHEYTRDQVPAEALIQPAILSGSGRRGPPHHLHRFESLSAPPCTMMAPSFLDCSGP